MATPIYKWFRLQWREAWLQLAKTEQDALLAKLDTALQQVGGKRVLACDSEWSNEQWVGFGVEEFPNIEAVQQYSVLLRELSWYRYIDSETMIGTRFEG